MVDFDSTKLNIQNQELSTTNIDGKEVSAPKKQEKPTLKYIFEQQMTRQQVADEFGQIGLDMFDKANTDGIDGISKEEFEYDELKEKVKFNPEQLSKEEVFPENAKIDNEYRENIEKQSIRLGVVAQMQAEETGKTTAQVIDEIKKAGVSSSVAKGTEEFRTHLEKILGTKPENVDWANVEKMSDEEMNKCLEIINKKFSVQPNMTRAEAEKLGGDILAEFNAICPEGQNVITGKDIALYKQNMMKSEGISPERILVTLEGTQGVERLELTQKLLGKFVDNEKINQEFANIKNLTELATKLGINNEEFQGLSSTEKGKRIGQALRSKFEDDMDEYNSDSKLTNEVLRLKNGKFTEKERKLGIDKRLDLSDNDALLAYAKNSIVMGYLATVSSMHFDVMANGSGEDNNAMVNAIFEEIKQSDGLESYKALISTTTIHAKNNTKEDREQIASSIYTNTKKNVDVESSSGYLYTNAILKHASSDTVRDYIEDNASQVEQVEKIARVVLQTMPEGEQKTNLETVINQTLENIYNGTISGYSGVHSSSESAGTDGGTSPISSENVSGGGYSDNSSGILTQAVTQQWSSNPITIQVYDTRQANNEWSQTQGIVNYTVNEQAAHISANKVGTELGLPEQIRYNPDRVTKLIKDINNSVDEFEKLTPKEQQKVKDYFTAAKPSTIVSIMVSAKPKVQQFLLSYISTEAIAKNIKKDDIKNLIGTIQENLAEYTRLNVQAGIRKLDKMTDAEEYMYKLNEKYN